MNWVIGTLLWAAIGALLIRTVAWSKFNGFMDELVASGPKIHVLGRRTWTIILFTAFAFGWPPFMLMSERRGEK